jgi:hypothetical protein
MGLRPSPPGTASARILGDNRLVPSIRLATSSAARERRLAELLSREGADESVLHAIVRCAQALGSLELAGERITWDDVRAAWRGEKAPEAAVRMRRAQQAVDPALPVGPASLRAWHQALTGRDGFRESRASGAAPELIESRLESLEQWLESEAGRQLDAAQRGALALVRVLEIRPFEAANGRVARLCASHVMVRAGARPPVLVAADAPRLGAAVTAAVRLDTEPLVRLLGEARDRSLDVMIQAIERGL